MTNTVYEINIPKAFKLKKPAQIWNYLAQIKEQVIYEMQNTLENLYKSYMSQKQTSDYLMEVFKTANVSYEHCSKYTRSLCINAKSGKSELPNQQNLYKIDTSVRVIFHEKDFYLIPSCHGIFEKVFDFMLLEKDLEEFSYNSQRKSPRIHQDDWDERGRIWNDILYETDSFELSLQFPITTIELFNVVDPYMETARKNWPKKRKRIDDFLNAQKSSSKQKTNEIVSKQPTGNKRVEPNESNYSIMVDAASSDMKSTSQPNNGGSRKRNIASSSVVYPKTSSIKSELLINGSSEDHILSNHLVAKE